MNKTSRSPILDALETSRSVVVEACAGSGKTWLLASRIVCLLLAGVAPGEILAITFTRKAAREIEERVVDWLHLLATGSDRQVAAFLGERGLAADDPMLRKARGLYERVLSAQPRLAVNTFHGWFLQLVDAAPLSANLAGATLVETDSRLFDELWQTFAAGLQKAPEDQVAQAFVRLLAEAGLESTRRLIRAALERRSEWLAYGERLGASASQMAGVLLGELREFLGVEEGSDALDEFFAGAWAGDFQAYLGFLEMSDLASDQKLAAQLAPALDEADRAARFERLRGVFLTGTNTLRQRKPSGKARERFGESLERFLDLHGRLGERLLASIERQIAERILAQNGDAFVVFAAFLAHVENFKKTRRQIDFVDAEWVVLKLLRDEETAAFLQTRLDARYSHVLLDEFQDTNPLQWQILLAWLDAYSDAVRPGVFMVGDPKQSIYRFRRAEPRLFSVAADYLQREFGALRREQDATWRNAQPIVDVVNALFLDVPEFAPFRKQASFAGALPGRVELLPLCARNEGEESAACEGLRDPLVEPEVEAEDLRLAQEAECLAQRINEMVGAWQIEDKGNSGGGDGERRQRAVRYGDIMLLVRTRTHLACYERALAAADIPFDAGSRGGLLIALEVRDILALVEFLVTPVDNLQLAHALRSPLFACSDQELMQLAERGEDAWWSRLQAVVKAGAATPRLQRAARLLGQWLQAADLLPAHDLLDRIYHQGEVIERYRLAAPPAAAAGIEANLRALLLLALDLDGGRYPSLPRFIDELRDLRDADSNDAPDEGAIETPLQDAGRVRILTIHGAKGLEAPIVWWLGANASPRPSRGWDVLVDWQPEAPSPQHFSFYGRKEEHGAARGPMFEAERAAARREELNLLYVAITRARQVFIASGIDNARDKGESPYRLLEAALEKLGGGPVYGDDLPIRESSALLAEPTKAAVALPMPPTGERRRTPDAAERFGILLHALLERRSEGDVGEGWWKALGFSDADYRRVVPVAERILAAPALRRFFDPALYRRAWNEVELAGIDGALLRLDRLVETDSGYWVLDYKSSGSATGRLDDYRQQVEGYCRSIAAAFAGKPVRGALIFADASLVEVA